MQHIKKFIVKSNIIAILLIFICLYVEFLAAKTAIYCMPLSAGNHLIHKNNLCSKYAIYVSCHEAANHAQHLGIQVLPHWCIMRFFLEVIQFLHRPPIPHYDPPMMHHWWEKWANHGAWWKWPLAPPMFRWCPNHSYGPHSRIMGQSTCACFGHPTCIGCYIM